MLIGGAREVGRTCLHEERSFDEVESKCATLRK